MLIHGEEIASRCDHILFRKEKFASFARLPTESTDKFIDIESHAFEIDNRKHVFVSTDDLWLTDTFNKLQLFRNPFTLVCGTSDHPFISVLLPLFDKVPNLQHIYSTNCCVQDPRVTPLPLGFQNKMWWQTDNDLAVIEGIQHSLPAKDRLVYFYFSVATNPIDRQECRDILERKGFIWDAQQRPFADYMAYIAQHRYCICPVGNGYDTHRFWEALAVRTIPVCLHNPIVDFYAQFLPIVVLNNWEELSMEMLEGVQGIDWSNLDILLNVENWNMFGPKP